MPKIEHIDYAAIDSQVQKILQKNNGNFPVIVYEKSKGPKHIIYIGERHGNDPDDKRFDTIKKYFLQLKPSVILNEGGQQADSIQRHAAEIGGIIHNGLGRDFMRGKVRLKKQVYRIAEAGSRLCSRTHRTPRQKRRRPGGLGARGAEGKAGNDPVAQQRNL